MQVRHEYTHAVSANTNSQLPLPTGPMPEPMTVLDTEGWQYTKELVSDLAAPGSMPNDLPPTNQTLSTCRTMDPGITILLAAVDSHSKG